MLKPDPEIISRELLQLRGGVADTCTLIYLDRIGLLPRAGDFLQMLVLPCVVQEFGRLPAGCTLHKKILTTTPDQAVIELACKLQLPVFSEDRQVLLAAQRLGLHYYNTLMILLALLLQEKISCAEYHSSAAALRKFARYSPAVWLAGEQVFSLYNR